MNTLRNFIFVFGVIAGALVSAPLHANSFAEVDSSKTDSLVTDSTITYYHVNLTLESEWGEPETYYDIKVSAFLEEGEPQYLILWERDGDTDTIDLLDGMIVTVSHPKSGEVLRTFYIVRPDEN